MSSEIVEAVKVLEQEKGIDSETLMAALEDALLSAYKKTPGAARYARVDLDRNTADFRVFELILPPELEEKLLAQVAEKQEQEIDPETGEFREPEEPDLDPEILAPYEDQITARDVTPHDFGRIAAQTAKQVILQRIREAERMMMYEEYRDRVGEPGYRSKIAVISHADGVDPVGACVGPRGSRVRMVVSELRGEKIDIIPYNTEPARFVAKALSPARVREVYIDDDTKDATVIVPDDQLALAIGKEGLNARLAARLTGWKVDIQSDSEFAQAEAEAAFAGDGEN